MEAQFIKAADSVEAAEAQFIKTAADSVEAAEAQSIKAADKLFEQALDLNVPQSTLDEDDEDELPALLSEEDSFVSKEYFRQLVNPNADEEYFRKRAEYFRQFADLDVDGVFTVTVDGVDQRKFHWKR